MAVRVRLVFDQAERHHLLEDPNGPMGEFLEKKTAQVLRSARRRAPRKSGELRADLRSYVGEDSEGLFGDVGTNLLKGKYQETGHVAPDGTRVKARRYLRPALRAAKRSTR
jgi:hypothetical protein